MNFMKKITYVFLLIFFTIPLHCGAQYWEYDYFDASSMGRQVILTDDSYFVVTGTRNETEAGVTIKLNQDGELVGSFPFGGFSICQTFDGGYVIASGLNYSEARLLKFDSAGEFEWNQTYGGVQQEHFAKVISTSDSCILACGSTYSYGDSCIYIVKTDSLGNLLWQRTFQCSDYGIARDLMEIDNHYFVSGIYRNANSDFVLFLIKLTPQGTTVFRKEHTVGLTGWAMSMNSDSTFIFCGSNRLIKLSHQGDMIWNKLFNNNWRFSSIDTLSNGGYIISGNIEYGTYYEENALFKADAEGNVYWFQTYPNGSDNGMEEFSSVITLADNGFITCGFAYYDDDIIYIRVLKADENGQITSNAESQLLSPVINVFPNPATDKIQWNSCEKMNFSLSDIYGRTILSGSDNCINILQLQPGLYVLTLRSISGDFMKQVKVLKK